MRRGSSKAVGVAGLCAALALGACKGTSAGPSSPSTRTSTIVSTLAPTPAATYTPPPARSVAPLPPGRDPRNGERERRCPYIASGVSQDANPQNPNVAAIEGDHVYRTTVLTSLRPVGCRFYFYAPPYEAVADIVPRTFASPADAHNALVRTAEAGTEPISAPDFVPGVDGISYRTTFFGPDGAQDWAFAFARGRVLVVVHTQQSNVSRNAFYLGRAIVDKF